MYNIYINERLLRFVSEPDQTNKSDILLKLTGDETGEQIRELVEVFESNNHTPSVSFLTKDIDKTWKVFCSNYKILEAAGGVVINPEDRILMIFRNGKWDLPKGKIEAGEDPETAAVREVNEECGIGRLTLKKQLSTTFHTYPFKDKIILKKTYWFLMGSDDPTQPVPQLDEGITDVVWKSRAELNACLPNAYHSIANLLKEEVLKYQQSNLM